MEPVVRLAVVTWLDVLTEADAEADAEVLACISEVWSGTVSDVDKALVDVVCKLRDEDEVAIVLAMLVLGTADVKTWF